MDGPEGEAHPQRSADLWYRCRRFPLFALSVRYEIKGHSRFNAAKNGTTRLSKLFRADKLSHVLCPKLLYLLLTNLSGEIKEYMSHASRKDGKYQGLHYGHTKQISWLLNVCAHLTFMAQEGENYGPVAKQLQGDK